MLRVLRIQNLAVIETAAVDFEPGFTVLTGETGAGKSILVEAVGLLLGARASSDLIRTGERQASIEALFDDGRTEVVLRREITSQGRSRCFVNGGLVTTAALKERSAALVELHGQHEHQALLDPGAHLGMLDEYAGLDTQAVQAAWSTVAGLRRDMESAGMDARERTARLELATFQLAEIERVAPRAGEDEELAVTRQVLANAERVQRLCDESYGALYDSDSSLIGTLAAVRKRVSELAEVEPEFGRYVAAAEDVKSTLEDLALFIRDYSQRIDASPARLQEVEDRLASIERLKRKYGPALSDVVERWGVLARDRELLSGGERRVDEVRRALDRATEEYVSAARALSEARRLRARAFAGEIEQLLAGLAMERTKVEVRFNEHELAADAWGASGIDAAEFFVSPNPGEDLRPLARIVSGGELSRIMLAFKTLGARRAHQDGSGVRTLIFDEVDAGIGGRVADVVGERLQDLGGSFQVLCITHLPQIAARASSQIRIDKAVRGGRTTTSVHPLDGDQRVAELARMIAGASVTDAVRATARDLLVRGGGERRKRK
jgi:DNA repair protein RecN (Recombination protein N)